MLAYVDKFYCKLFHVHHTASTDVLDYFLYGLQSSMHVQVLVSNPSTFTYAALLAERVAGAHGKAACNGPQPMDLGAVQCSGKGVTYHVARQGNSTRTGQGHSGHSEQGRQWLCHY